MSAAPSHRERLQTALAGQAPDRVPLALWRHFPVDDQTPEGLAAATAAFQRAYDFDLMKVTPTSSFCLKDWGVTDHWSGNPEGTRDYTGRVIHQPQDWEKLTVLDPSKGHLEQQLTCLKLLTGEFRPNTPVIQTIFSPMAQAKNLIGGDALIVHLRRYPEAVHKGLETITESTLRFIEAARETGIDGVFYAIQHAQYGLLTPQEFDTFGATYDLQLLDAVRDLWLNLLHLHGSDVMFDVASRYPAAVVNWHDRESGPSLQDGLTRFTGAVCGGLRQWDTMVLGSPKQVLSEANDAITATGGRRFILGTGCVLPTTAPYGNIQAARQAVMNANL
jgi:uroporphyrinogen decarboxylase